MPPEKHPRSHLPKKRSYTTAFKKQVVNYYDRHKHTSSFTDVALHFQIPLDTVKAFYRRRQTLMSTGDDRKRHRECRFPQLESDLLCFIELARSKKLPVTGGLIMQKARLLRSKHNIAETEFQVSRGWLHRFLGRWNIGKSVRLYGEAGSVNVASVRGEMVAFCLKITKYHPEFIYNEDESGFLYQLLPNITYLAPDENRKEIRGVKAMREKHRVTFTVCTNATGSHVLPLFVIGKSAKPRAFAFARDEDDVKRCYANQSNSWMTGTLFDYYIRMIWYPEVRKRTSENVCLIIDNCSAHGAALPILEGVEYVALPPNVTSVYQPMDQGIIRAIKVHARADLLSQVIETMHNRDELRTLGYKQKEGMRGLKYAHAAHVLDAIQILHRSIKKLTAKKL